MSKPTLKTHCHRLKVNLSPQGDELQGRIEFPEDHVVTLECLAEVIRQFADHTKVPKASVCQDVYALVMGYVNSETPQGIKV